MRVQQWLLPVMLVLGQTAATGNNCRGARWWNGKECVVCEKGYRVNQDHTACVDCHPGFGSNKRMPYENAIDEHHDDDSYDVTMSEDRALTEAAAPKCDECAYDSISQGGYEASCVKCPPGQVANYARTQCVCAPRHISPYTECDDCKGKICTRCPDDKVSAGGVGSDKCIDCSKFVVKKNGEEDDTTRFWPNVAHTACQKCVTGWYENGDSCYKCEDDNSSVVPNPVGADKVCVCNPGYKADKSSATLKCVRKCPDNAKPMGNTCECDKKSMGYVFLEDSNRCVKSCASYTGGGRTYECKSKAYCKDSTTNSVTTKCSEQMTKGEDCEDGKVCCSCKAYP